MCVMTNSILTRRVFVTSKHRTHLRSFFFQIQSNHEQDSSE